jgi:hypothetical protein
MAPGIRFFLIRWISSDEIDRLLVRDGNIGTIIDNGINIWFKLRFTLKMCSIFDKFSRIINHIWKKKTNFDDWKQIEYVYLLAILGFGSATSKDGA